MTAARFNPPRRVVVKVGSSSLRGAEPDLDQPFVAAFVAQLAALRRAGADVVVVSSGAVAAGLAPLGFARRPRQLPGLQAAASVGQSVIMQAYQSAFAGHGVASGQVLLTPTDVVDRARYLNARNTFETLMSLGAVPVVNENDTVVTDELRFGDNDRLAALVASMLGADLLLLLSDVDGLMNGHPDTEGVKVIDRVDDLGTVRHLDAGVGSQYGRGGMASKFEAVRIARFSGVNTVIGPARQPHVVEMAAGGEPVGTWFPPSADRPDSRKLWIAFAAPPEGAVTVDAGAVQALVASGSSLLPAGVTEVSGEFAAGAAVDVVGPDGRRIARGLVHYGHDELAAVRGRSTRDAGGKPVIHRDALVVL